MRTRPDTGSRLPATSNFGGASDAMMLPSTPTWPVIFACGVPPSSGGRFFFFAGRLGRGFVGERGRAARAAVEVGHRHFLPARRMRGRDRGDLRFREHLHRARIGADPDGRARQEAAAFDRHRRAARDRAGARRDVRDRGCRQRRAEERPRRAGVGFFARPADERRGVVRGERDGRTERICPRPVLRARASRPAGTTRRLRGRSVQAAPSAVASCGPPISARCRWPRARCCSRSWPRRSRRRR